MAARTHDSSGSSHEGADAGAGTPISSCVGVGIIVVLMFAMILLQAFTTGDLEIAN